MTRITLLFHHGRQSVERWVAKDRATEAIRRYRSLQGLDVRVQRFSLAAVVLVLEPIRPARTRAAGSGGAFQKTLPLGPYRSAA